MPPHKKEEGDVSIPFFRHTLRCVIGSPELPASLSCRRVEPPWILLCSRAPSSPERSWQQAPWCLLLEPLSWQRGPSWQVPLSWVRRPELGRSSPEPLS